MDNLIEKLKKNKTAFGLMSPEEQECFKKVGKENCLYFSSIAKKWTSPVNPAPRENFSYGDTYAIKPDYQPEPEYENMEVEEHDGYLGVWDRTHITIPFAFTHLHCLPSLPNFQGFFAGDMRLSFDEVSTHMEGKPYARFRS